jgi:GT2 family glycosyltransferase
VSSSVSVIVLAYRNEERLERCLDSVEGAFANLPGETELVVVLNEISPAGRERLGSRTPAPVLVEPGRNLGFAAGVTAGLARARGDWIALVNDDCVVYPDTFAELLVAGERAEDIGSVAAQVRWARRPDRINSAGIEIDKLGVTGSSPVPPTKRNPR